MVLVIGILVAVAIAAGRRARALADRRRLMLIAPPRQAGAGPRPGEVARGGEDPVAAGPARWGDRVRAVDERVLAVLCGTAGGLGLGQLTGPVGWPAGAIGGAMIPLAWKRRARKALALRLEAQLGDLVESCALAVRTGLSIPQALEFAAGEAEPPMRQVVGRVFREQRLGAPFEEALEAFGARIGTDDSRLFVLVLSVHARSGGDLAGALDDVAATMRQRIAIRRELRALSAQGRISGGVLGSLPLLFFLVLAATSRAELEPVYRSPAGVAMIGGGLAMQGVAYMWIRRMLRVEL